MADDREVADPITLLEQQEIGDMQATAAKHERELGETKLGTLDKQRRDGQRCVDDR